MTSLDIFLQRKTFTLFREIALAWKLFSAAPESLAPYVLLSNIYSSEGRWKEKARTIKRMREMGVSKETVVYVITTN
ncbi:hypothetical protein ACB094_03G040100 [Castanea mollissima]